MKKNGSLRRNSHSTSTEDGFVFGMKKDAPLPEAEVDIDELTEKYLNEEKHESFFDD